MPGVAQRVGRGIALLLHDRGTRRGWVVSSTPRPHFTHGKDPVPILLESGWAAGSVWTGRKSLPHRDSIPDRPARISVVIPTELPGPHLNPTWTFSRSFKLCKNLFTFMYVCFLFQPPWYRMMKFLSVCISLWMGVYFSFGFLFIFIPNKLVPSAQNGICCACRTKFRQYLPPAGFLLVFS